MWRGLERRADPMLCFKIRYTKWPVSTKASPKKIHRWELLWRTSQMIKQSVLHSAVVDDELSLSIDTYNNSNLKLETDTRSVVRFSLEPRKDPAQAALASVPILLKGCGAFMARPLLNFSRPYRSGTDPLPSVDTGRRLTRWVHYLKPKAWGPLDTRR